MLKKKIFIEINVPGQLKRRLAQKVAQWADLPVKWLKEESLHITVSFIGYVDESVIPDICQKVNEAVGDMESFEIVFDRIVLAPDVDNPRMIQLVGEPREELGMLNEAVESALGMRPEKHKRFAPHLTLGRIRKMKWDELIEKPVIDEKFNMAMTVDSVLVMESRGGGAEYVPLEECPLA